MSNRTALQEAIDAAGGQTALAAKIGVTQSLVHYWLNMSKKGVAAEHVHAVHAATGIPAHRLRPDIFGGKPSETERAA
jgi:DNA-binding transcriptional regulator YdaS (Cro superfamily)